MEPLKVFVVGSHIRNKTYVSILLDNEKILKSGELMKKIKDNLSKMSYKLSKENKRNLNSQKMDQAENTLFEIMVKDRNIAFEVLKIIYPTELVACSLIIQRALQADHVLTGGKGEQGYHLNNYFDYLTL